MTEVPPDVAAAAAPAKATKKKTAVARPKKVGPSINDLIVKAVSASKERNGLSLPALKKRLDADGYDVEKNNFRIKVAIRSLLQKGTLVHTKGIGASGSFKISKDAKKPAAKAAPKAKKPAVKKPAPAIKKATPKRAKKPAAKKSSSAKKATTPKKAKKPAVVKKAVIKKSPKKVVTKKVAAKSTKKAPKPVAKKSPAKKATKSKAAKKAAPKKK